MSLPPSISLADWNDLVDLNLATSGSVTRGGAMRKPSATRFSIAGKTGAGALYIV